MSYLIIKSLHIIFMVSYFSGIFYLVRIFVYYKDTDYFPPQKQHILREQYAFMAKRLWNIITVPAGILMLLSGLYILFFENPSLKTQGWFHLKLLFLSALGTYHYWCWRKTLQLDRLSKNNQSLPMANIKLRQYNEIATFLLFLIVFVVMLKTAVLDYWWQLLGSFFVLVALITLIVKLVNKKK